MPGMSTDLRLSVSRDGEIRLAINREPSWPVKLAGPASAEKVRAFFSQPTEGGLQLVTDGRTFTFHWFNAGNSLGVSWGVGNGCSCELEDLIAIESLCSVFSNDLSEGQLLLAGPFGRVVATKQLDGRVSAMVHAINPSGPSGSAPARLRFAEPRHRIVEVDHGDWLYRLDDPGRDFFIFCVGSPQVTEIAAWLGVEPDEYYEIPF
jgi:hypothetical protein